jgi:DNA polymerase elongation subunit (family B)
MLLLPPLYTTDLESDTSLRDSVPDYGLDPRVTPVTDIATLAGGRGTVFTGAENDILTSWRDFLLAQPAGLLVTWNGCGFDGPFIADRARILGVDMPMTLKADPDLQPKYGPPKGHPHAFRLAFGAHRHVDIAPLYKDIAAELGVTWSLKPVYEAVTGKKPVELDRANMHLYTSQQREEYVLSDVLITEELALLLPPDVLLAAVDNVG